MKPLHVAFVWHMHQPSTRRPHETRTSSMGAPALGQGLLQDAGAVDAYPKVRATFNLVPSLLARSRTTAKRTRSTCFLNISKRAPPSSRQRSVLRHPVDA